MLPVVQVGNVCADLLCVALYLVLDLEAHLEGLMINGLTMIKLVLNCFTMNRTNTDVNVTKHKIH